MPESKFVMLMLTDEVPDCELRDVLDGLLDHLGLETYRESTPLDHRPANYTFKKRD